MRITPDTETGVSGTSYTTSTEELRPFRPQHATHPIEAISRTSFRADTGRMAARVGERLRYRMGLDRRAVDAWRRVRA